MCDCDDSQMIRKDKGPVTLIFNSCSRHGNKAEIIPNKEYLRKKTVKTTADLNGGGGK